MAKITFTCTNCGNDKTVYKGKSFHQLFCSNQCQRDLEYKDFIKKWQNKEIDGITGVKNRTQISAHIKRYIRNKYNDKCVLCGWGERHLNSKYSACEIDHIDGFFTNNYEENLRLLCPNCHSLTSTFKARNKGRGSRVIIK